MDKRTILQMIEYCALSYRDCQPCKPEENIIFINTPKHDVQCYVRTVDETLVITFRGSDSWRDAISNLRFWKKKIPYGNTKSKIRVHTGFIDTYKSEKVRDIIHCQITHDIQKVQIMGHSLGAALSVLCAADLQYNYPGIDYEVLLLGCPRVGNRAFQKSYNKRVFKTFRVENGNDFVTKIPLALLGFRHVGIRLHVGIPRISGVYSFAEHRLSSYYGQTWKQPAT